MDKILKLLVTITLGALCTVFCLFMARFLFRHGSSVALEMSVGFLVLAGVVLYVTVLLVIPKKAAKESKDEKK